MKKVLFVFANVLLILGIVFSVISCKKKNNEDKNPGSDTPADPVAEINFEEKTVTLELDGTYTINIDVKNATGTFTYTIDDETIVSVKDGVVTALKEGRTNVKIKVVCDDKAKTTKEFTFAVEVVDNREFTITYSSNIDGFSMDSEKVKVHGSKSLGTAPTIDGYEFVGWSLSNKLDGVLITEISNVEGDVTVFALYKPMMHTITFEGTVDGFSKDPVKVEHGKSYKLPTTAPSIEGYKFVGWSLSLEYQKVTNISSVTEDMTVYAFYELKTYTITFQTFGGVYTGADKVKHGETLEFGKPTRDGYKFLGWSLVAGSTDYITSIVGSKNLTVYANWKEIIVYPDGVYPITWDLDGGQWSVSYYTPAEIGAEFVADFAVACGHSIEPERFDCAYMESSWFVDMVSKAEYLNKWMWLFDAIWAVAGGTDSQKASVANWSDGDTKGLYIGNLCGFFTSTQHKDAYLGPMSANYADPDISKQVYQAGPAKEEEVGPETYTKGVGVASLPTPMKAEYIFKHWVDQNDNIVTSISTTQEGELELKAIWEHETIAEDVEFTNIPAEGIKLYDSLQLEWIVTPNDAVNKKVLFYSMDETICSVTEDGLIKTKSVGTGKIRIRLESNSAYEKYIDIIVWSGEFFDVSYETNSYVELDQNIKLNAAYIDRSQNRQAVTWTSRNEDIATVDENGVVTGHSAGVATIRAKYTNTIFFDFVVTVLPEGMSEALQFVVNNHHSNAQTTYNLGIGDGNPEYYYDVVGGVNNILFDDLKIDRRYYDQLPDGTKNYGEMTSVEFITVHYTGNMRYSADADNNCDYFNNLEYRASIHYVTGRTNLSDLTGQESGYSADAYYAFAGLNEKYGGWHATNADPCVWDDSGLTVLEGDPLTPVISISKNLKYTINGRETNIKIPDLPDGYSVDGDVLTVGGKQYTVFNQYGIRAKVEDGKYYIARTHWGTQRSPRAICTCGGNRNSIGIESCVDIGSDLEHTWHVTAQLVAQLLVKYNLGFDRVVGHHFFSGKDCPQPFLEEDMKLWYQFMDMVKAEYELLTTYKTAVLTAKALDSQGILRDNGLLVQDADAHCVTYQVTVEVGGKTETITLATCVESYFKYTGTRTHESLQLSGQYPII